MLFILIIGISMALSTSGSPAIENHSPAQVLRYDLETANMPNSYKFSYDSSDGTSRTEEGAILNPGTPDAALNVLGTVRWYDDKGQLYEMSYKGGKRGYQTIIKKIS
ncbi:PREDICTED: endocuticle structural glycoprotein ABD-5-like [Papilio xuthus]|uniref:Cuticular protein PxutCPR50 n=1 Tax=Papilio xuthus TaxID=66420 RepID=I4DKH5_PAPXU|nr:endocuticle structural glycoprotein ABD-5-like precursor [Papilio xuthus]BAM18415.1 cuticular protein PxutCPR50 [Papilio xuthus]